MVRDQADLLAEGQLHKFLVDFALQASERVLIDFLGQQAEHELEAVVRLSRPVLSQTSRALNDFRFEIVLWLLLICALTDDLSS